MIYTIAVLLTAAISVVWGFRRGLGRQAPGIIGVAFGIISARLLAPGLIPVLYGAFPTVHDTPAETFVYDTIASAIVFFSVYFIFSAITRFLGSVFGAAATILGNLGGAIFALFRNLLFLSVLLNLIVALRPDSGLTATARAGDGNTVFETMLLSPALLGGEDVEDLSLRQQLHEARQIS